MDYIIRGVDEPVWKRLKHLAVDMEKSLRELILQAIKEFVERSEARIGKEGGKKA